MTVLTMRYLRGHFVVTGPDLQPLELESQIMLRTGATTSIIRARPCKEKPRQSRASKSKARREREC